MGETNVLAARLASANKLSFGATAAEFGQALQGVRTYLAALQVSIEHGEQPPHVSADAQFLGFARIVAEQMVPQMRAQHGQNRQAVLE